MGGYARARLREMACAWGAGLALRMWVGSYNVLRMPRFARATAVQVQWLGDVPVFAALGQVVMRIRMLLNVCWGGGRTKWAGMMGVQH
jgi:hypothetical protein